MLILLIISIIIGFGVAFYLYKKRNASRKDLISNTVSITLCLFPVLLLIHFFIGMIIAFNGPTVPLMPSEIQQLSKDYQVVNSQLYNQKDHKFEEGNYQTEFKDVDYPTVEVKCFKRVWLGDVINPFSTSSTRYKIVERVILPKNAPANELKHVKVQDTYKIKTDSSGYPA